MSDATTQVFTLVPACLAFARGELLPRLGRAAAPRSEELLVEGRRPTAEERLRPFAAALGVVCDAAAATALLAADPGRGSALPALATAAFEAALDLQLLDADPSGERVRQALAFDLILRLSAADKLAAFRARAPRPATTTFAVSAEERARLEAVVREVWGFTRKGTPRHPEHWSGLRPSQRLETLSLARPDVSLKLEELYREGYFLAAAARATPTDSPADAGPEAAERRRSTAWHRLFVYELLLVSAATCATVVDARPASPELATLFTRLAEEPSERCLRVAFAEVP
ncbi:MAG: hypothetical protein HYZ53_15045 [Planctomycetes bacterium]|nr:hypothetical protein [Planctomycetota bacterium]